MDFFRSNRSRNTVLIIRSIEGRTGLGMRLAGFVFRQDGAQFRMLRMQFEQGVHSSVTHPPVLILKNGLQHLKRDRTSQIDQSLREQRSRPMERIDQLFECSRSGRLISQKPEKNGLECSQFRIGIGGIRKAASPLPGELIFPSATSVAARMSSLESVNILSRSRRDRSLAAHPM